MYVLSLALQHLCCPSFYFYHLYVYLSIGHPSFYLYLCILSIDLIVCLSVYPSISPPSIYICLCSLSTIYQFAIFLFLCMFYLFIYHHFSAHPLVIHLFIYIYACSLTQSQTTSWGLSEAGEYRCCSCPFSFRDDFSRLISFLTGHRGALSESGLRCFLRCFLFVQTVQVSKRQAMPLCAHLMSKLNAKEEKFGDNWTQEGCRVWGWWWAVDSLIRSAYDELHMVEQLPPSFANTSP